ncbi:hypothetical protein RRSWK_05069 [Rhodopirellula sp. SWK7]|nr:hypothetical protein RRSWK_05069 [Rhodopirellula sp. SWK7]
MLQAGNGLQMIQLDSVNPNSRTVVILTTSIPDEYTWRFVAAFIGNEPQGARV